MSRGRGELVPVITLTTDFGQLDSYAAQVKGRILSINPTVQIVDVTHSIPPQDIRRAAVVVSEIVEAFPAGTIHVVVVDPGVGGTRRIIGAEIASQRFVAPDNGVLSLLIEKRPAERIFQLSAHADWRPVCAGVRPVSDTFHGRDIMAPVAARWSLGMDLSTFGTPAESELMRIVPQAPYRGADFIEGCVEWVDAFGNLITNVGDVLIPQAGRNQMSVKLGGAKIHGMQHFYGECPEGELMALIGSSGKLEVAVNRSSAAKVLNLGQGAVVRIEWSS